MEKIDKNNIKNILIIRRNNIGDMICAIPILRSIRREFPEAHLTVLADSTNSGIVEGASFIDRLLVYKKGRGIYGNKYFGCWRLFRQNKTEYDLTIALKIGFSSTLSLITLLSGTGLRMGCMPIKWHPFQYCYNLPVRGWKKWKSMQTVNAFFEFIRAGGIESRVEDISIEIAPASRERVRAFLKVNVPADNKVIIFNISNNKPENTWPIERFKEIADVLSGQYKATCIITSAPSDREKAMELSKDINNAFYCETPEIMDFAALAADADLLICGEGGAMHVGSGVHTTTISLWGKLRPVKWTPYGKKQFVLKKGEHVNSISSEDILDVIRKNNLLKLE
jgi:ADP-heptose:LPS heptosyltransferase